MRRAALMLLTCLAGALTSATVAQAQSGCAPEVAEFRRVVEADARSGNLNKRVYGQLSPELDRITVQCRAGQDKQALTALRTLKHRYGYP